MWFPAELIIFVALKEVEFVEACVAVIFYYMGKKHCGRAQMGKIRIMSDLVKKEPLAILKAI